MNRAKLAAFSSIVRIATPQLHSCAVPINGWYATNPSLVTRTFETVRVLRCRPATWRCAMAMPSHFAFDRVPQGLPDWWNEDDDDNDNDGELGNPFSQRGGHDSTKFEETDSNDGGGFGGAGGGKNDGGGSEGGGGGGSGGDDGNGNKSGPLGAILTWYLNALSKHPLRTKTITTCILAMLGDLISQYVAHDKDTPYHHNTRRTLSIAVWAIIAMGPLFHFWYTRLDQAITGRFSLIKKLSADQLLFTPVFLTLFMFGTGFLEGNSWDSLVETWRTKMIPTLKANYTLWPPAQAINFTFIPPKFQVLYINCVAILWNSIVTYITHDHTDVPSSVKKVVN